MPTRSKRRAGTDGRSPWARRHSQIVKAFTADFGGDVTTAERALISTAATLQVQFEELEAKLLRGEERDRKDDEVLVRMAGTCNRILSMIQAKKGKRQQSGPSAIELYEAEKRKAQ
jgi:hypothetical protein